MITMIILTCLNGLFVVVGIWSASRASTNAYIAQRANDNAEMHANMARGAGAAIGEILGVVRRNT